jgi:hypothetical protein
MGKNLVSLLFIIVLKGNAWTNQRDPCFNEIIVHCRWYFKSFLGEIMGKIATSSPET